MKKLMLGALLSLGISSTLFAEVDLISLATNGEFNEQSKGVKILNDEEMSKVVGGAYVTGSLIHQYGTTNNSGTRVSYTAYYELMPESNKPNELLPLNVDDGSGNYKPVVSATLNHLTNQVSISIIGANQYNPVYTRSADRNYANQLLNQYKSTITDKINSSIRSKATTYWGN